MTEEFMSGILDTAAVQRFVPADIKFNVGILSAF